MVYANVTELWECGDGWALFVFVKLKWIALEADAIEIIVRSMQARGSYEK